MLGRRYLIAILLLVGLMALPAQAQRGGGRPPRGRPPGGTPPPPAETDFEFRVPTGKPSPAFRSSRVTVPNIDVFAELAEGEAALRPVFEQAIRNAPRVNSLTFLRYQFPVPKFVLAGEGTQVVASIDGIRDIAVQVRFRPKGGVVRFFCGSNVRVDLAISTAAVTIGYDFFTGDPINVDLDYTGLRTGFDCNRPFLGEIAEAINDIFDIIDPQELAIDALSDGVETAEDALNGRFSNRFALQDILEDVSESGPREIRASAEQAIRLLGGVRSAVAAFIANEVTEDLIERLNLQTQGQVDALLDRLDGLEEFIALGLLDLNGMSLADLNAPGFDLSDYLDAELPEVQDFLYDRLNIYYANVNAAILDLEVRAIDALEDFVGSDFGRLFGGVNVRLQLIRSERRALIDAFHDAPEPFNGIVNSRTNNADRCSPRYVLPRLENVAYYSLFNANGKLYYEGPQRAHRTEGVLAFAIATNHYGLHSYPAPAQLVFRAGPRSGGLIPISPVNCPLAGEPLPPPPPPPPPPPRPGPGDDCGRGSRTVCR